jgi:hypothetical protein
MGDAEEEWVAEMPYGAEPSAAPRTEALVRTEAEMTAVVEEPAETVELDTGDATPEGDQTPDVNAGAKKTAIVLGGALLCAVVIIAGALVTVGDDSPPPRAPTPVVTAAAPAPTSGAAVKQDQAVPFTASANCPAGSTSAQALTDAISDSAWVCVRGAQGATVDGQVLHADFGRSHVLSAVSITPGWVAKTPGGKDE